MEIELATYANKRNKKPNASKIATGNIIFQWLELTQLVFAQMFPK